MFAFGWLRVGSFSGCICTRVDFVGCNCAWNMRVYFFVAGGAGVDKYVRLWLAQGWEFRWVHLYQGPMGELGSTFFVVCIISA